MYICNECVEICNEIIAEELGDEQSGSFSLESLPKPAEINAFLNEYIIGRMPRSARSRWRCTTITSGCARSRGRSASWKTTSR